MTNESAELLRHAIIARACMDYDQALMYLAKPEEKRTEKRTFENECQKIDCERFFEAIGWQPYQTLMVSSLCGW